MVADATFPQPKLGKITIKVINRYGNEMLKFFEAWTE